MKKRLTLILFLVMGSLQQAWAAESYDVVIYGGTSAGVTAAVQVSRMGKTVLLIGPDRHLGGLSSGGLGKTDSGNKAVIGGVSREFYQRLKRHYDKNQAWTQQKKEDFPGYDKGADAIWRFEPKVAEMVFEQMIEEAKIPVIREERLDLKDGVTLEKGRIVSIHMESGKTFQAKMFIDATYEGDLMAKAGVSYTLGREANAKYKETLNGVQPAQAKYHQFIKAVDPYRVPGDKSSGLLPGVQAADAGKEGEGDKRIQAYCFRMCLTDAEENRRPFPKPEGYEELRYELLLRNFEAGDHRIPWLPGSMPNRKTDTNNKRAISLDNIGMNYDYPEAGYSKREQIIKEHETYQKGLMWTLVNHPRVPKEVRDEIGRWGLAKDEFVSNGNWPHQLYIREARRMVGDYVLTEHDCRRKLKASDPVGLGSYTMDSHHTQRYVDAGGQVRNEGDVEVSPGGAYLISYRAIVPKREEVGNLLVPVCISASHIAYGSIRMEPVFMILGQSAATGAVMAIEKGVRIQDVPYAKLRERLLKDGQVLDLPEKIKPETLVPVSKLEGVVVDDENAEYEGGWKISRAAANFVETGYRHDRNEGKGEKTAAFIVELKEAGKYDVRITYPANTNRASNVPVTIHHRGGQTTVKVNQKVNDSEEFGFISLGVFEFEKGATKVVISNKDTNGHVTVDAVQWLKK